MLRSLPMGTSNPADCDPQEKPLRAAEQIFLVAEDDPAVRRFVVQMLETKGHRVLCGSNGREALQVSREFSGVLQLVITDVEMPEMNGVELAEHIKAERPGTPVLVISGRPCTAELPFLAKPFN